MINYENNKIIFFEYIEKCRKDITNLSFDNAEIIDGNIIKTSLVNSGHIDKSTTIENAIKVHRNNMIDIKFNHTRRIVDDVVKISNKLDFDDDFKQLLKLSALFHDIARFPQAVNSNSFFDRECKMFNGDSHAEYGYKMLYINNMFEDFDIDKQYRFAIANSVRYHQIPILTGDLSIKFNNANELDTKHLTGNDTLTHKEKVIIATLVQIVKDVDMLDILYQHKSRELPIIKPYISVKIDNCTIDEICGLYGVCKKDILIYHNLAEQELNKLSSINIPVSKIDFKKLEISVDIKTKFFNNEYIDLKELQNRQDYTFITGMWWRLNHFLNNINLVSNLEILEENNLLEQIYNQYPKEYRFLVKDAFEYAQNELLEKRIKENKGKVYIKK